MKSVAASGSPALGASAGEGGSLLSRRPVLGLVLTAICGLGLAASCMTLVRSLREAGQATSPPPLARPAGPVASSEEQPGPTLAPAPEPPTAAPRKTVRRTARVNFAAANARRSARILAAAAPVAPAPDPPPAPREAAGPEPTSRPEPAAAAPEPTPTPAAPRTVATPEPIAPQRPAAAPAATSVPKSPARPAQASVAAPPPPRATPERSFWPATPAPRTGNAVARDRRPPQAIPRPAAGRAIARSRPPAEAPAPEGAFAAIAPPAGSAPGVRAYQMRPDAGTLDASGARVIYMR